MKTDKLSKYLSQNQPMMKKGIFVSERIIKDPSNLHWHNYLEIELIIGGSGSQNLNGKHSEIKRGTVSVLRPTDYHQVNPKDELKLINISLEESLLSETLLKTLSANADGLSFRFSEKDFEVLENISLLCLKEYSKSPNIRFIKNMLECFFIQFLRTADIEKTSLDTAPSPIRKAVSYLHMHFREDPSLTEIAELFHYNASHFSAAFHKEVGVTYTNYLTTLKINYAKGLLSDTDLKITEICFESGFSSQAGFLRAFKNNTGVSPVIFRRHCYDS